MELMKHIPDKSVDMILCDLPYGTTQNEWDKVLPLDELWIQYERIIKDNGVIVLTSDSVFTAKLIMSNPKLYRYSLVWNKVGTTGFLNANRMPLRQHEDILVFYKNLGTYNPQMITGKERTKGGKKFKNNGCYGDYKEIPKETYNQYYPTSIITVSNAIQDNKEHSTQKPVELFRYLIKTYTNEGELVLDNCIGSGTTAVACKQANRNFIGIELSQEYVDIANKRLQQDNLHAFFQTQGVLTEPSPNRNLKDLSTDKSQISANAETSLNSDIIGNFKNPLVSREQLNKQGETQ